MKTHWFAVFAVLLIPCTSATQQVVDPDLLLQKADRLAWLTDWYSALPIYAQVERTATNVGNRRDALYAKFGRLRAQMQMLPLPDISEQITSDLETALAKQPPRLRLRGLTVKGDSRPTAAQAAALLPNRGAHRSRVGCSGRDEALVMLSDILPTGFECGVLNGKIAPGDTVAIVGAGPVGLATLMTAQFYTPGAVLVLDLDEKRLRMAQGLGATTLINTALGRCGSGGAHGDK